MLAELQVKKLLLRAYIGFNQHEIGKLQDVNIHFKVYYDTSVEELSDKQEDAMDYKNLTKQIIALVDGNQFNLLENLTHQILNCLMLEERIKKAIVEVEKPHALRFADSVSFTLTDVKS